MLHAFCTGQQIGQFLNVAGLPFHHDDLKARVVVEVRVNSGDDLGMVLVLDVRQPFGSRRLW